MPRDAKRLFDPRSPVQRGDRSPWLWIFAIFLLALAAWGWLNDPWNDDGEQPQTTVTPPAPINAAPPAIRAKANLASFFRDDDYPPQALRNGEQGTVRFRLAIAADGRITDCRVTGSSGSAALDRQTCSILRRRARYQPARDSAGHPVADRDNGEIRWVLAD